VPERVVKSCAACAFLHCGNTPRAAEYLEELQAAGEDAGRRVGVREVDCLTLAGHFEGRYVGEKGEIYTVTPAMLAKGKGKDSLSWICVRDMYGPAKAFPSITYVPSKGQILWGAGYFMEVEDFATNCDVIRWFFATDPLKKLGPRFAWKRATGKSDAKSEANAALQKAKALPNAQPKAGIQACKNRFGGMESDSGSSEEEEE